MLAQSAAFEEFLKPTRQPLADALGAVVGVVVVRRVGPGNSCGMKRDQWREE